MPAKATTITIDVANLLDAANLSMTVFRKSGATSFNVNDDNDTKCFVYPGTTSMTAETRGWSRREISVIIQVFRFLNEDDATAQVDGLYELLENIEDTVDNTPLGNFEFVEFASDSSSRELLDPDTQTSKFTFEAMVEVTYYESTS